MGEKYVKFDAVNYNDEGVYVVSYSTLDDCLFRQLISQQADY